MAHATLYLSLAFAAAIAVMARATSLHRGPFAYLLRRLRARDAEYRSVATMLWVVAIGAATLGVAATLLPQWAGPLGRWSILYFAVAPSLVAVFLPLLRRHAS